jgi:hypothetical protein
MTTISFFDLPIDIQTYIYSFDPTYRVLYNDVLSSMKFSMFLWSKNTTYDKGYTIRNFPELGWAILPRYYDKKTNTIKGHYIHKALYRSNIAI